jgi:hypothetical protein
MLYLKAFWSAIVFVILIPVLIFVVNMMAFPSVFWTATYTAVMWGCIAFLSYIAFDIFRLSHSILFHKKAIELLRIDENATVEDCDKALGNCYKWEWNNLNSWNSIVRKACRESITHRVNRNFARELELTGNYLTYSKKSAGTESHEFSVKEIPVR